MAKKKEIKSIIDLHCHSNFGSGKDSILRLYNHAVKNKMAALVITDKYPAVGASSGKISFYEVNNFLEDLKKLKDDGWQQKIPIIVGMEYVWPEWLVGGFSVKTLIFGEKAIDQLLGLERYRKVDGLSRDGKILKTIYESAEIISLSLSSAEKFRLVNYESGDYLIERFNEEKKRWIKTSLKKEEIPTEVYGEPKQKQVKRMLETGETISDIWNLFELALTCELIENEEGIIEEGDGIESAVVLCSPDPNQIKSQEDQADLISSLPSHFLNILDSVEVSYKGQSKMKGDLNYSLQALYFADSLGALPVVNSDAMQAELYGKSKFCNEFSILIKSESDLIKAILDGDVTNNHWKSMETFCKEAKEVEDSLIQDGNLIFSTGAGDDF